jgi:hypothetical protein
MYSCLRNVFSFKEGLGDIIGFLDLAKGLLLIKVIMQHVAKWYGTYQKGGSVPLNHLLNHRVTRKDSIGSHRIFGSRKKKKKG